MTAVKPLKLNSSGDLADFASTDRVPTQQGGTNLDGSSAANGNLLIGNGSGFSLAALTAGTGISVTNGSGTITVANTGSSTLSVATQTGNFNAAFNTLELVDLNAAAGSVVCTLPDATTGSGQTILLTVSTIFTGAAVSFASTSSQTINGIAASSLTNINKVDQTYFFISDGSNWWTITPQINLANNVKGLLPTNFGGTGANNSVFDGDLLIGSSGTYIDGSLTSPGGSLTITPSAGAISAVINLAHSNTFTAAQTFNGIVTQGSGTVQQTRVVTAAGAVTVATTDYIIVVNKTSGAATTVNLMSSPTTGTIIIIKDGKGDANTNNITITPAAGNIDGISTFVINLAYGSATLVYNGSQWNVI